MAPVPGSSKDTNAMETTNYRFRHMSSFSKLLFLRINQGEKKNPILLRFPNQNLLICLFCPTWQEIVAQNLLHKFLTMGQTLQTVRHRQDSVLKAGTVERKNI